MRAGATSGFGLALLLAAGALLIWNENRSAAVDRALEAGRRNVTPIEAGRLDPANEGRLVFLRGAAVAAAPIVDPDTGASLLALHAARKVEMYQWREHSKGRRGGGQTMETTSLSLSKAWSERAEPTTIFMQAQRVENPPMPFGARQFAAPGVRLGAFALSPEALTALPKAPVAVEPPGAIGGRPAQRIGDALVVAQQPNAPEIGDLRIVYTRAPEGAISLVGRQTGDAIAPHRDAQGETLMLATTGLHMADDLFGAARGGNAASTWFLRVVGGLAMWGGFALALAPLRALGEALPVVGGLLTGSARAVAFVAAALASTLAIGVGWTLARPIAAFGLAAAAAACALAWRARRPGPSV